MKFGKILGVGVLAAGLMFTGCIDDEEVESAPVSVQKHAEKFPQFSTVSLNGDAVTENLFAQKKITVVNIWGTFCGPCIGEMPELGEWARNIPADAQIIGIICDVESPDDTATIKAAKKILRDANANFVNLVPDNALLQYMQSVEAVPTTFFVDSQGHFIGEPVVGADVDSYKEIVESYLK